MIRTPGKPELILFHEVTPATVLKALNESAEATTGGGARTFDCVLTQFLVHLWNAS